MKTYSEILANWDNEKSNTTDNMFFYFTERLSPAEVYANSQATTQTLSVLEVVAQDGTAYAKDIPFHDREFHIPSTEFFRPTIELRLVYKIGKSDDGKMF